MYANIKIHLFFFIWHWSLWEQQKVGVPPEQSGIVVCLCAEWIPAELMARPCWWNGDKFKSWGQGHMLSLPIHQLRLTPNGEREGSSPKGQRDRRWDEVGGETVMWSGMPMLTLEIYRRWSGSNVTLSWLKRHWCCADKFTRKTDPLHVYSNADTEPACIPVYIQVWVFVETHMPNCILRYSIRMLDHIPKKEYDMKWMIKYLFYVSFLRSADE